MKVGDLVKHIQSDECGVIVDLIPGSADPEKIMVAVEWVRNDLYQNDWLYQSSRLEVVNDAQA